jgi:hypothetical protein
VDATPGFGQKILFERGIGELFHPCPHAITETQRQIISSMRFMNLKRVPNVTNARNAPSSKGAR